MIIVLIQWNIMIFHRSLSLFEFTFFLTVTTIKAVIQCWWFRKNLNILELQFFLPNSDYRTNVKCYYHTLKLSWLFSIYSICRSEGDNLFQQWYEFQYVPVVYCSLYLYIFCLCRTWQTSDGWWQLLRGYILQWWNWWQGNAVLFTDW